jgi:hypothetical protein
LEWSRLERSDPELTAAVLRFHFAELIQLPPGARLREEHQSRPTAEDWLALLGDYAKTCLLPSDEPGDQTLLEEIRGALPGVGYQLTKHGIRRGRSPVDRVLARSEAKTTAAVEILAAEADNLGARLRALVLCDHEYATATLPARLRGVLAAEAGSARLVLTNLLADHRTSTLEPVLITGKTVAADAATARKLVGFVGEQAPHIDLDDVPADAKGIVEVTGRWRSRFWVPLVTRFYETGESRALVGTRALLGEGWDAKGVNTLIDLTTATTPTSVVQTRGRALRIDPTWPEKTANSWTVVCVSENHPGGTSDWKRFVRKHQGYFGVTDSGEIASGVGHVDPSLSPYRPPREAEFDAFNAQLLQRAEQRDRVRELWQVGTPYRDQLVHTIRVRPARHMTFRAPVDKSAPPVPPEIVPSTQGAPRPEWLRKPAMGGAVSGTIVGSVMVVIGVLTAMWWLLAPALAIGAAAWQMRHRKQQTTLLRAGRALAHLATPPDPLRFGYAVADAMKLAVLSPVGAHGVRADVEADGSYRLLLDGVDPETSRLFTTSLDEVLAPLVAPRYVAPRYVPPHIPEHAEALLEAGRQWLEGAAPSNAVVYHAMPTALGSNIKRRDAFAKAWRNWVSEGNMVATSTPEGEGILVTHRGQDPFAATTRLRVAWD